MSKTIFLLVNGICTNPEDVQAWTDRAEEWINNNTKHKSTKMEYRAGALTRRFYQNARVDNLQKICKAYPEHKIILVGHSNGCDIIQRLIQRGKTKVHELHLIAGASERDFEKNGYNKALKEKQLEKIVVYWSPIDEALKKAKLSTQLFGWLGLGYGYLGLTGPDRVECEVKSKVIVYKEHMSHSQWFSKRNFEKTMRTVTNK